MISSTHLVRQIGRRSVQHWLPRLDEWLLPDSCYGVQHTWPQLYRNDGHGAFFVVVDGDQLLSHCACRIETLHDESGARSVGLIGSVATHPEHRGRGLASQVLAAAIAAAADKTEACLLWAEHPGLYQRAGFAETPDDTLLLLARRPRRHRDDVRPATITDHGALHALHQQKPRRIERTLSTMSTLLTTPGMTTVVLERDSQPIAYACCGKGADLHGHWHELGGRDEDLAALLPAAMHIADEIESALLLPPYRQELRILLGEQVVDAASVPGPMVRSAERPIRGCWVDGLDSV